MEQVSSLDAGRGVATRYLQALDRDEHQTIATSEVSLAGEILETIFGIGYEIVSEEKKKVSTSKMALNLCNELDMMRTWAGDLHIVDGALQRVIQGSRELRVPLYKILGEFLLLLLSYPKVKTESKSVLRVLEDKISWILSEIDDYKASKSKSHGNDDSNSEEPDSEELDSEESESELELDFEEFVEEFKDSSEVFRFLACNLSDEIDRTGNKIFQEPPKVFPTLLIDMPEYQFKVNIQDKLPHAEKHLVERLASECWRLYKSIVYGLQKQREMESESALQPKSNMTASASDEGYKTASNRQTLVASSLVDGLPQKVQVPMDNIAHYALSIATSAPANTSDRPKLPRLPPGAKFGKPFTCHICSTPQLSINNLQDWKKHIYADLQPYTCTFETCSLRGARNTVRYSHRNDWWQHEMNFHRLKKRYRCVLSDCEATRCSRDHLIVHVRNDHPDLVTIDRSWNFSDCLRVEWDLDESLKYCPFCKGQKEDRMSKLSQHIAHHFEDQALIVLGIAGVGGAEEDIEEQGKDLQSDKALSVAEDASSDEITGKMDCLCGLGVDSEYHIQCDRCNNFQHTHCVGVSVAKRPDIWICHRCEPKKLSESDKLRVHAVQRAYLVTEAVDSLFPIPGEQPSSSKQPDSPPNSLRVPADNVYVGDGKYKVNTALPSNEVRPSLLGTVFQFDRYVQRAEQLFAEKNAVSKDDALR